MKIYDGDEYREGFIRKTGNFSFIDDESKKYVIRLIKGRKIIYFIEDGEIGIYREINNPHYIGGPDDVYEAEANIINIEKNKEKIKQCFMLLE